MCRAASRWWRKPPPTRKLIQRRLQHGAIMEEFAVPAQRPAAPHRDQPRSVEGVDHEDDDRQYRNAKPSASETMLNRDSVFIARGFIAPVQLAALQPIIQQPAAPPAAAASTTAAAEATGQSLLVKNSSHSVWPIISELEPAKQIGNDEFADDRNEAQQHAGGDPRATTAEKSPAKTRGLREAPRSLGCLQQRRVHFGERRIERQDHERQIGIDDAEIHRAVG